ncbi:uncharacterized protein [Maniola hyperantus]|uniref:uncharacterized protein n=1 Tax=Aphantopus hyperantus TaxID=2795564 RepID=UPI00374A9669
MSAYLGNLQVFDHKTSEWQIFKGKLVQFLKINKVPDEESKIGVLLTHMTDETYRLVRNLAFPKELESLSYAGLIELLDSHFKLKQCSFADKAKFYGASRSPGESLGDWAARLRGLAVYCDFGTALETNLLDRFVLGLGSGPERDKLFEQKPSSLTLGRAIELAEQAECAKKAKALPSTSEVQVKEEPLFRAKFQGRAGRAAAARKGRADGRASDGDPPKLRDTSRCSVCGLNNHKSEKCFFRGYKCKKCFQKGHLKKVCPNSSSGVYHVDDEELPDGGHESCEECHNINIRFQKLSVEE